MQSVCSRSLRSDESCFHQPRARRQRHGGAAAGGPSGIPGSSLWKATTALGNPASNWLQKAPTTPAGQVSSLAIDAKGEKLERAFMKQGISPSHLGFEFLCRQNGAINIFLKYVLWLLNEPCPAPSIWYVMVPGVWKCGLPPITGKENQFVVSHDSGCCWF